MLTQKLGEKVIFDYGDRVVDTSPVAQNTRIGRKAQSLENFRELSKATIIHGHFYATKYLDIFPQEKFVSILRHPTTLVPSYYHYLRNQKRSNLLTETARACESFNDFMENEMFQNIISKLFWPLSVEQFAYIGFVENFDASMQAYSRLTGTDLEPEKKNVAKSEKEPLNEATMQRLRDLNRVDIGLYERAYAHFNAGKLA